MLSLPINKLAKVQQVHEIQHQVVYSQHSDIAQVSDSTVNDNDTGTTLQVERSIEDFQ